MPGMPNFEDGSELKEAGPNNGIYLPFKTQITIKFIISLKPCLHEKFTRYNMPRLLYIDHPGKSVSLHQPV